MSAFRRPRVLFPLTAILLALGLGGCVAYPVGYDYGGGYYNAAPVYGGAVVAYGGDGGYRPYHHRHHHRYYGW